MIEVDFFLLLSLSRLHHTVVLGRARNELEILYQSQLDEQHRTSERQYYERIESLKRDHEVLLNEQSIIPILSSVFHRISFF